MTAGSPPAPTDVRAWALYIASVADSAVDAKAAVDEAWTQAIAAGVDRLALRATILGERGRADQIDPSPEIRGSRNGRVPGRRRGISRESRQLRDFVLEQLVPAYDVMTVRQVFYQCASVANLVPKTENGYKKVQRQLLAMRRSGELPWSFIADGTRWQRKPSTWESSADYVEAMSRGYRRNLWQSQGVRIEIWLEKDALAGVIIDTTRRWDVALMVSRGQSSATFLHSAAEAAAEAWTRDEVETFIYTLYDHDPGGALRAQPTIQRDLPQMAAELADDDVPIWVEALAVTPQQIAAWNLPTRPGKSSDTQAKQWGNRPNVELDAIDPNQLSQLVENAIKQHVNAHEWEAEKVYEQEEQRGLEQLAEAWRHRDEDDDETDERTEDR